MLKKISVQTHIIGIAFLILGVFLADTSLIMAQKQTHIVQKGDTLWDICETYYGDSELWPKLWEMNQFVTNPHLLEPGDVITLLDGVPIREGARREGDIREDDSRKGDISKDVMPKKRVTSEFARPRAKIGGPLPESTGIDISSFVNLKNLGFLSRKKVEPWGQIVASDGHRKILSPEDKLFVVFDRKRKIQPGDEFTIAQSSPVHKHPITGGKVGYIISFNGRLVIEEQAGLGVGFVSTYKKKNTYVAKMLDMYRPVILGDMLIPYESHSSCIRPVPVNGKFLENIVAARDDMTVLGELSIVYIDRGFDQGIRRGNLFEIVKANVFPKATRKSQAVAELFNEGTIVFPDTRIGTMLILDARPDTSTAIVLSASDIFSLGTTIKGGFTPLERTMSLSSLPTCPMN